MQHVLSGCMRQSCTAKWKSRHLAGALKRFIKGGEHRDNLGRHRKDEEHKGIEGIPFMLPTACAENAQQAQRGAHACAEGCTRDLSPACSGDVFLMTCFWSAFGVACFPTGIRAFGVAILLPVY